jgi:hypothetical protein
MTLRRKNKDEVVRIQFRLLSVIIGGEAVSLTNNGERKYN